MKKICILAAAAAVLMAVSACSAGTPGSKSSGSSSQASQKQASSVSDQKMTDNLKGLEAYLSGNGFLSGDPSAMKAEVIGAKKGDRYQFSYEGKNNVTVELYEYNKGALNDSAKQVLNSVKSQGKFPLMGQKISAVLSDSGKYLMIYKDTDSAEAHQKRAEQVKKLFAGFKA